MGGGGNLRTFQKKKSLQNIEGTSISPPWYLCGPVLNINRSWTLVDSHRTIRQWLFVTFPTSSDTSAICDTIPAARVNFLVTPKVGWRLKTPKTFLALMVSLVRVHNQMVIKIWFIMKLHWTVHTMMGSFTCMFTSYMVQPWLPAPERH